MLFVLAIAIASLRSANETAFAAIETKYQEAVESAGDSEVYT
jgi:hypothetical protein